MAKKKTASLTYITLRVKRPMSKAESEMIGEIKDAATRTWEIERQSLLFEIAVLARDKTKAISLLRKMLRSPDLIIESRSGVSKDVTKIPPTKRKKRRVQVYTD